MLVTISATRPPAAAWPATDLGYLLAKNPARLQSFEHAFGRSQVFYPEADADVCTAALLLEVDPIALVKSRNLAGADFSLAQYVNDRPYAASSLLAVALGQVFRTGMQGRSKDRPQLAATPLPLRIALPAVPARAALVERLFAPLGWSVAAEPLPLDPAFPDWGDSRYCSVELSGEQLLSTALTQLYVLLPVLDGAKHYWMAPDEVDKLMRAGEAWLATHPDRTLIIRRYLGRRATLVRTALARLAELDEVAEEELDNAVPDDAELDVVDAAATADADAAAAAAEQGTDSLADSARGEAREGENAGRESAAAEPSADVANTTQAAVERTKPLATLRREAVMTALGELGAKRVLDLGCGDGALLGSLLRDRSFTEIVGVDVSARALQYAARKLRLDRMPERIASRLTLKQGSLTYTDATLKGYDAAVLMEVVEHVDPPRLPALEYAVFAFARPGAVVVTTPNAEYNVRYETLEAGRFRHRDHRFEWSRGEFAAWAGRVGERYGYAVEYRPVGEVDPEYGPSTQMAVFTLREDLGDDEPADEQASRADKTSMTDEPAPALEATSTTEGGAR